MKTITTINPATKESITTHDLMSKDAAFEKVEACHAAFLQWRKKTHEARAPYIRAIAGALRDKAEDFAGLMTQETGKLLRDGNQEVELCAQIFEYTAEHGPAVLADESRTAGDGNKKGRGRLLPNRRHLQHPAVELPALPTRPRPGLESDGGKWRDSQTRQHLHGQWSDAA